MCHCVRILELAYVVEKNLGTRFFHKQLSEHVEITNIDNTKDLRRKPEAGKITEEREFTTIRRNYSSSRVCCDY